MVKQTISIFLRLKPPPPKSKVGNYDVDADAENNPRIHIQVPKDLPQAGDAFVNNRKESFKFRFNGIFDTNATQEEIFNSVAKPVVQSALQGYNGTVFAYGQTGSGKTFTITGGAERYADRGIIPRVLAHIFEYFASQQDMEFSTAISYLEIYNETGYDLLDPKHMISKLEDLPKVTLFEDEGQNMHLKNLSIHSVNSEMEALNLLFLGDTNRMIAETPMNEASTRSHCIFTIHLTCKELGSSTVRRAKLHLVDLAGSERVYKTGVNGTILTEAKYINLSLHYLEQVIVALSERNRSHIPYRNSMMTMVLKDSLGGNCMTTMIATASIERSNLLESISTCRFAQRVALIKNDAILNEELDPQLVIERLRREIEQLKGQLLLATGQASFDELSLEDRAKCENECRAYLQATNSIDPMSSYITTDLRRIHLAFSFLRQWCNERSNDGTQKSTTGPPFMFENPVYNKEVKDLQDIIKQRDTEISILVDMLKKERLKSRDSGHTAPPIHNQSMSSSTSAMHPSLSTPSTSTAPNPQQTNGRVPPLVPSLIAPVGEKEDASVAVDRMKTRLLGNMSLGREEAFEVFKNDYMSNPVLMEQRHTLKQLCAEAKSAGQRLNEARTQTSRIKNELERHHTQRALAAGASSSVHSTQAEDAHESQLRHQLESETGVYHETYARLKSLKSEIEHLQHLMEVAKVKLVRDFEIWWTEQCRINQEKANFNTDHPSSRDSPASSAALSKISGTGRDDVPRSLAAVTRRPTQPLPPQQKSTARSSSSNIPMTGDPTVDADIRAFMEARQKLRERSRPNG